MFRAQWDVGFNFNCTCLVLSSYNYYSTWVISFDGEIEYAHLNALTLWEIAE